MSREKRRELLLAALRQLVRAGKRTTSYAYLSWRYGVPESEVRILYQVAERQHATAQ
jgi:hypothetical protein